MKKGVNPVVATAIIVTVLVVVGLMWLLGSTPAKTTDRGWLPAGQVRTEKVGEVSEAVKKAQERQPRPAAEAR